MQIAKAQKDWWVGRAGEVMDVGDDARWIEPAELIKI